MPSHRALFAAALLTFCLAAIPRTAFAQFASSMNPMLRRQNSALNSKFGASQPQNPQQVIKDVKAKLSEANPDVRVEALKKLRDLESPQANRILIHSLADPDIRVKIKAVDLLGARGANSAVGPLSQMLFLRSTQPLLKLHVVAALGRIGDSRGALPVMQYLEEEHAQGDNPQACGTAAFALGEMGNPKATPLLTSLLATDKSSMVRQLAKQAIEKIGGELPSEHSMRLAQEHDQVIPTDERLAKLRKFDKKLEAMGR